MPKGEVRMEKEKRDKFEMLAKPLIQFINDNCNPHAKIIITTDSAEILYGEAAFYTKEFIKD